MKYSVYYDEFEEVLLSKKLVPSYPSGSNEETTFKIIHSSDELGKKLRALQMSLKITGVQGIDHIPSFTEVFSPIPCNYKVGSTVTAIQGNSLIFSDKKIGLVPRFVQPIECVLQFEMAQRSGRTPFHQDNFLISNIQDAPKYRLYVPKEIGLMKRAATEMGVAFFRESAESFEMEKTLNIMPKIVGALKGIQSQHPSYGPGTALVKRWLRSQLIDSYHISDIVINLLNASLYLNDTSQPNTPQMSFLRCLKFFSEFNWNLHAVTVNFNDELSSEEILEFENRSQTNREAYPNEYIINPFDQGSSVFTKSSPSKEILLRIKQLSLDTLSVVSKVITERNAIDVKSQTLTVITC
ncbi:hypothetical protein JTB14_002385 [Gonioctena quinquepunctata]|nr:hypothetical protein JTB14_002385 [Gonioctena quinquepunctata]